MRAAPLDRPEHERWRAEAAATLRAATAQAAAGGHNWACFLAEQAAQLAIKAVLHGAGRSGWGHDLVRLGAELGRLDAGTVAAVTPALRRLSRHYVTSRYPDASPGGSPHEHYGPEDAEEALADAAAVVAAAEAVWTGMDG